MFSSLSLNVKIVLLSLVVAFASLASSTAAYKWQENKYENLLTQQASANDKALKVVNDAAAAQVADQLKQRLAAEETQAAKDKLNLKDRADALKENGRIYSKLQ